MGDDGDNEDGSMLSVRSPQASAGEGINSASEQAELDFAFALSMSEGADNQASEQEANDVTSKMSKSESSNCTSDDPTSSKDAPATTATKKTRKGKKGSGKKK